MKNVKSTAECMYASIREMCWTSLSLVPAKWARLASRLESSSARDSLVGQGDVVS